MCPISIEINTRNIALFGVANATFMALEEEVRTVIVLRVSTILPHQDEIGVFIRLGFRGLNVMTGGLDVPWCR
jgi:hypothetical protein